MGSSSLWGSRLGEQQQQKFAPQRDSNLTSQQVTKYSQGLQTVLTVWPSQSIDLFFKPKIAICEKYLGEEIH